MQSLAHSYNHNHAILEIVLIWQNIKAMQPIPKFDILLVVVGIEPSVERLIGLLLQSFLMLHTSSCAPILILAYHQHL